MNPDKKNPIIAFLLIGGILIIWQTFFITPNAPDTDDQVILTDQSVQSVTPSIGIITPDAQQVAEVAPHISISSDLVESTLSLQGARIDGTKLLKYRVDESVDSPLVDVLASITSANPYYAYFGWTGIANVPNLETVWESKAGEGNAQILTWTNKDNIKFEQIWNIGSDYMFQVELRVTNASANSVSFSPYGVIARTNTPETKNFYILHEGLIAVAEDTLVEVTYEDILESKQQTFGETTSWLGITDKYWLTALIPDSGQVNSANFVARLDNGGKPLYQTDYILSPITLTPGTSHSSTQQLYIGAKEVPILSKYQEQGIVLFDRAVDFGWYYFLTKPIFTLLHWIASHVKNFGVAIIILTIFVRFLLFPLAQRSYTSMTRMKKLAPELTALRERHANDRQKLSLEMMQLYKKEKINPLAGCLPILVQIPIFFCLYKVLYVTIEMRHAPFFGWISDLSAPDPAGILILFGLASWTVPDLIAVLNIGIWPILMGATMALQMKMNPSPADPIQKKIFTYLPIVFTFFLGQFAAGLIIYWTVSNILSMLQQWVIMRRMGVKLG